MASWLPQGRGQRGGARVPMAGHGWQQQQYKGREGGGQGLWGRQDGCALSVLLPFFCRGHETQCGTTPISARHLWGGGATQHQ